MNPVMHITFYYKKTGSIHNVGAALSVLR